MEYFHGLIILAIVIKVVLISVCCCIRYQRLNACGSNRRRLVAMDDTAVTDIARARMDRRSRRDRISIIGQAEPMGTSTPPRPSVKRKRRPPYVKRDRRPPSYEQATINQNPNHQNQNPHGSFPQGPIVCGPYPQDPNAHGSFPLGRSASGPYPQDPNTQNPFQQDPHARDSYPRGPNAPAPYTLDARALGLSCLDGDAQAPSAPCTPAVEPSPQNRMGGDAQVPSAPYTPAVEPLPQNP